MRRSVSTPNLATAGNDQNEEDVFHDDKDPDTGKTLHVKDGKLGFFASSKGFVFATNF